MVGCTNTTEPLGRRHQNVCPVPSVGKLETVPESRGWVNNTHIDAYRLNLLVSWSRKRSSFVTAPADLDPFGILILIWACF